LRFFPPFLLLLFAISTTALAQDIRFVSGSQSVPLRDGPGDDYAIVHRGIADGTRLTVARTSEDGLWADITTDSGDMGWIPTAKLVLELSPEATRLAQERAAQADAGTTAGADASAASGVAGGVVDGVVAGVVDGGVVGDAASATDPAALLEELRSRDAEFNAVAQELHRLKQVSGKAEQLDIDNRRLVEKTENLRSEVDMLHAENRRLLDKVESEDFMNGALAVLLGVIIALVAPRLVPKRRKSSSW
jgi:SH3 domain protein